MCIYIYIQTSDCARFLFDRRQVSSHLFMSTRSAIDGERLPHGALDVQTLHLKSNVELVAGLHKTELQKH